METKIIDVTSIRILKVLKYLKLHWKGDVSLDYLFKAYDDCEKNNKLNGSHKTKEKK